MSASTIQARSMSEIYDEETQVEQQKNDNMKQNVKSVVNTALKPVRSVGNFVRNGLYVPPDLSNILESAKNDAMSGKKVKMLKFTDEQLQNMSDYSAEAVIANGMVPDDSSYMQGFMKYGSRDLHKDLHNSRDFVANAYQPPRREKTLVPLPKDDFVAVDNLEDDMTAEDFGLVTGDTQLKQDIPVVDDLIMDSDEQRDVYAERVAKFGDPMSIIKNEPESDFEYGGKYI